MKNKRVREESEETEERKKTNMIFFYSKFGCLDFFVNFEP